MNVYILFLDIPYESSDYLGVFSNLKAARKAAAQENEENNKSYARKLTWSKFTDYTEADTRFGHYRIIRDKVI